MTIPEKDVGWKNGYEEYDLNKYHNTSESFLFSRIFNMFKVTKLLFFFFN